MLKETRYKANDRYTPHKELYSLIQDLPKASALGYQLARRNLKAKYRKSFLGIFWAFMPPLATAFVWIILQKQGLFNFPDLRIPYPIFVLTGIFLWQVFVFSITVPLQTMQANRALLVKINFPREAILFAAVFELLFNVMLSFMIIVVALIWFKIFPGTNVIAFVPYFFGLLFLGLTIGLLVMPLSMLFTDVQFLLPLVLQFAMYLTPVIYPKILFAGNIGSILDWNPVTPLLTNARASLLGMPMESHGWFFVGVCVSMFFVFLFGMVLLRGSMRILIERLGS